MVGRFVESFEYGLVGLIILLSVGLSVLLLGRSYRASPKKGDREKLAAYECGFDPFEDARSKFDIRFYLLAILFIVFDLEAAFVFPWVVSLGGLGAKGFWVMIDFFGELLLGLIYAWKIGALEWE